MATIDISKQPKPITVKVVEVSDESINKIAEAVVRKLADRKTEPTISKMEQVGKDEPTWEQVKEYCNKRCLDIVDSAMRKQWYKDEPQNQDEPPLVKDLVKDIVESGWCSKCKYLLDDECDCDIVFTGFTPKDEPQTERSE